MKSVVVICMLFLCLVAVGENLSEPCLRFEALEAHQGVAVDAEYVYAVDSAAIGKYDKFTGKAVKRWKTSKRVPLHHLNSGFVLDGKLYCAHSNYPALPMTSSIEIWDVDTLEHSDSHSFGIRYGSCTWIDRHEGYWWVLFAQYGAQKGYPDKDASWTTLIKFDDTWQELEGFVFPASVLERFHPYSCSGGSWGSDNMLYCTGHDHPALYVMRLPEAGSELILEGVVHFGIDGQGIAFDRSGAGLLYGIIRDEKTVVAAPVDTTGKSGAKD